MEACGKPSPMSRTERNKMAEMFDQWFSSKFHAIIGVGFGFALQGECLGLQHSSACDRET